MKAETKTEYEKVCAVCQHAAQMHTSEMMLCEKRGPVDPAYRCHRFSYDPLKRKPRVQKPPKMDYVGMDDL